MAATLNRQRASGSGAQGGGGGYVIENSLRFNELDSAQLNYTNSSAPTDASKGIVGCWIKRTDISHATNQTIIAGGSAESVVVHFNAGNQLLWREDGLAGAITTQLFRDPTAWFHLLYSYDSDEGTAANRLQLFINGVEVTAWATAPQNIGSAEAWGITTNGQEITWGDGPNANTDLGSYLAQAFIIDGLSIQNGDYAVSDFIDTDSNGNVIPVDLEGAGITWGNNGSLLDFAIAPGTGNGAGEDVSGNDNHFSESGLAANDRVSDSPTDDVELLVGNYATLSPIGPFITTGTHGVAAITNGNLYFDNNASSYLYASSAFIIPKSGKWAFQVTFRGPVINGSQNDQGAGLYTRKTTGMSNAATEGNIIVGWQGDVFKNGSAVDNGTALAVDDVVEFLIDVDADTIKYLVNSSLRYTSTSVGLGNGEDWFPGGYGYQNELEFDFGQTGYEPSDSAYLTLNTANLPEPAVKDSSSHVQTELYVGNATNDKAISQSGNSTFQPDHVVVKNRDTTDVWKDIDVVRGATEQLNWDHTTIETTEATGVKSFDSSGFTLGTGANGYNDNTENFLSMMWKLGGTASSNTDGDITSSVSVNSTSGLVRGTYSGSGTNNQTVGHGLGQQPDFLMVKRLDTAGDWVLIADGMGTYGDTNHRFNSRAAVGTGDNVFNDTAPGTSVFTLGDNAATNASGGSYMFWAGYSVAGFSRYGVHEGNGNADGGFVYCGFTPLIVIHELYDTASEQYLWLNDIDVNGDSRNYNNFSAGTTSSTAEASTSTINIDILSNGFKYRGAAAEFSSGSTFTMAWAKTPFGGSGVSQARAR